MIPISTVDAMVKGIQEVFTIKLKLDRPQRKRLDGFLDLASEAVKWIFMEQKGFVHAGVPLRPEELQSLAAVKFDLDSATVADSCRHALDKLKAVLGGEMSERKNDRNLFDIDVSRVRFSVFESLVHIPHVGTCGFIRNRKILTLVEGISQLRVSPTGAKLDYLNNDVVLRIDTVDRSPKREDFTGQRLVKVVRKTKDLGS